MRAPLADVLGAEWTLDAPVTAMAWSGGNAGFALGDGSVAIARAGWQGAPALRPRAGGGVELVPADGPPPPLSRASVARGPCLALAGAADAFLAGGADGVLRRVAPDGDAEPLAEFAGAPVSAVAATGTGQGASWACIAGDRLHTRDNRPVGGIAGALALASHPTAGIAVSHAAGVSLLRQGAPPVSEASSAERVLRFDAAGARLAAGPHLIAVADGAPLPLPDAEPDPRDTAFSADGALLAQAGSGGVLCWDLAAHAAPVRLSRAPALAVAFHPKRRLLAIAYAGGAVTLGEPVPGETLTLRPNEAPPTHSLAFDREGAWLAMGGVAVALVHLPDLLFRPVSEGRP